MELTAGILVLILLAAVLLLLSLVTLCVVRCFRPQQTQGPDWYVRRDGAEQIVKRDADRNNFWLTLKDEKKPVASV